MASVISLITAALSLVAFWLGIHFFDSYIVAILFLISAVIAGKSMQPTILSLTDKFLTRFFPLPELYHLYSKGFNAPASEGASPPETQGMRVLAMTENLDGKQHKASYREAAEDAISHLRRESELFDLRYNTVLQNGLPVEWLCSACGEDGKKINKCFNAWMSHPHVVQMKSRQTDRDMFIHDGTLTITDGSVIRYTVIVLFDAELPAAIPTKAKPEAE